MSKPYAADILCLDPDPGMADIMEKLLVFDGIRAASASDGVRAARLIKEMTRPDPVVLFDMRITRGDAQEIVDNLLEIKPGARFILVAPGLNDAVRRIRVPHPKAFVKKPVAILELHAAIARVREEKLS